MMKRQRPSFSAGREGGGDWPGSLDSRVGLGSSRGGTKEVEALTLAKRSFPTRGQDRLVLLGRIR